MSEHETVRLARALRYDLTAMQGKVSELLVALGRLSLVDDVERVVCPECELDLPGGERRLAEHRYVVHAVPLPEAVE